MLIVMNQNATPQEIQAVVATIEANGYTARPIPGGERVSIGILNNKGPVDADAFSGLPGVKEAIPVTRPYKLVSREFQPEDTIVQRRGCGHRQRPLDPDRRPLRHRERNPGPDHRQAWSRRPAPTSSGAAPSSRAPRPTPSRGMGEEGLKILAKVREKTGLPVVTEVMDDETFDLVEEYADIIQIGTRNMQNFSLLRRAGRSPQTGHAQARHGRHHRRVADGRGVYPGRGQHRGDSVRAGGADLCQPQPQHPGHLGRAGGAQGEPSADHHRPQPRRRAAGTR